MTRRFIVATVERAREETTTKPRRAKPQRARVRVFGRWCKGCGLCIAFCPKDVFAEDDQHHPVVAHPENCVACQWCAIHCPDFAITVDMVDEDAFDEVAK
jgi:2-oxoglutarate ferredoxin oxidoreductase subunit delta